MTNDKDGSQAPGSDCTTGCITGDNEFVCQTIAGSLLAGPARAPSMHTSACPGQRPPLSSPLLPLNPSWNPMQTATLLHAPRGPPRMDIAGSFAAVTPWACLRSALSLGTAPLRSRRPDPETQLCKSPLARFSRARSFQSHRPPSQRMVGLRAGPHRGAVNCSNCELRSYRLRLRCPFHRSALSHPELTWPCPNPPPHRRHRSFLLGAQKTSLSRNLIPVQSSPSWVAEILAKALDPEKWLKS